jgi:hypothetical protein
MKNNRRVDVGECVVWTSAGGCVHIGYEGGCLLVPEEEVPDMLKALSTWHLMGRTSEVVIKDE